MEKQLRQKLYLLENGVARIAHTRNQLKDNADLVRREIGACFGHQLCCLRSREQELLSTLDTVLTVKDELLSEQQDQLHQSFGACRQGLECLTVAKDDKHSGASVDAVELNVQDILNKLSSVEIKARETSQISFEADTMSLRRTLHSFGRISTCRSIKPCESLPGDLEDYDDEPTLIHKPLQRQFQFGSMRHTGMSSDRNSSSWLMKEALSGPTSNAMDSSGLIREGEQKQQVRHWLHQIKTQTENEPAVFEDFEITRQRFGSENGGSMLNGENFEGKFDPRSLFSAYFNTVLESPMENWILKETTEQCEPVLRPPCTSENNSLFIAVDNVMPDLKMDLPANMKEQSPSTDATETWLKVFAAVKESSNDNWLSSEYHSVCDSDSVEEDIERLSSINGGSYSYDTSDSVAANFRNLQIEDDCDPMEDDCFQRDSYFTKVAISDTDIWLAKPDPDTVMVTIEKQTTVPEIQYDGLQTVKDRPMNMPALDMEVYDSVLGWQKVLEKVHGGGDEMWLSR